MLQDDTPTGPRAAGPSRARPPSSCCRTARCSKGFGIGAVGEATGEVCFNTAMTGYQEILTDPSYAGQIITFTFPHIGNVGTNEEDIETRQRGAASSGVRGVVLARRHHRPVELARDAPSRRLAQGPRHRRHRPASTPAR